MTIISGKYFSLIFLVLLSAGIIYSIIRARKPDTVIGIRPIAGLECLEEIVGRATETGRPIHFTTGLGGIEQSGSTARVLGGLAVMSHVAKKAAKYNAAMLVSVARASTYAVTREVVRNAYGLEGHADAFQESMVRFLSEEQFAYATSAAALMHSEKVAGNIMIGSFGGESLLLAESGSAIGAIQVAGDTNVYQIPFFVVTCDYTLLGDEMFAAGATLGGDRDVLGSLLAQDVCKAVSLALIVIGAILTTVGSPVLNNLFKW